MASHNTKYYIKKIRKRDSTGTPKISSMFQQHDNDHPGPVTDEQPKQITADSTAITPVTETGSGHNPIVTDDHVTKTQPQITTDVVEESIKKPGDVSDEAQVTDDCGQFKATAKYMLLHPWLHYDYVQKGYKCTVCKVFAKVEDGQETAFIDKSVNWKSSGGHPGRKLKQHEDSSRHQAAVQKEIAYMNSNRRGSVIQQLKTSSVKVEDDRRRRNRKYIKNLAKLLYKMVTKHWAISDNFEEMVRFMATDMNYPVFKEYLDNTSPDATYLCAGSVNQLLTCLSNSIERELLNILQKQSCFAIMADETTDRSNEEQFAIFARFPGNMSMEHYLGVVHVHQTTAKALMEALSNFMLAKGIDIKKTVFIAFDGCNTMSGVNKGVQRRFRHQAVYAIYINCRNHKLALCFKHLFRQYPLLEETDACLVALANMFAYSPQKQAVLEQTQEVKGEKVLLPIRPSVTRWLSHRDCCVRLAERYESIVDSLDAIYNDKGKDPQVYGIRASLLRPEVVVMVLTLCEVLSETNKLSLILQKEDTNFMKLPVYVEATVSNIQEIRRKLEAGGDQNEMEFFKKCDGLLEIVTERISLARRNRSRGGDGNFDKDGLIKETICPLLDSLVNEINDAFHCQPVLRSFGVLDPRNVPEDMTEMQDYGEHEIEVLANHYGQVLTDVYEGHQEIGTPFVDGQRLQMEFRSFKHQMFALKKTRQDFTTLKSLIGHFETEPGLQDIYPNINIIMQMANNLPTGTASVERAFSHLGAIKTKLRTSMAQGTLDKIMRCSMHDMTTLPDRHYDEVVDMFRDFGYNRKMAL